MEPVLAAPTTPITFTSSSPELELPDPRYLKLHAAFCRVGHLSGAAEYLDKQDRDVGSMPVLSNDGSSNELLASRLQRVLHIASKGALRATCEQDAQRLPIA